MNLNIAAVTLALTTTILPAHADQACDVHSGPNTAALVELFTSEGCSSCPPADRALNHLAETLDSAAVAIPLALHVGYWDTLGWVDRFAQGRFAQRQAWLVRANAHRTVYTPQIFVAGVELQPGQASLQEAVRRLNAKAGRGHHSFAYCTFGGPPSDTRRHCDNPCRR
jgi:hypothetical protein